MKRPAPPVQQQLDVGNQAGAADTTYAKTVKDCIFCLELKIEANIFFQSKIKFWDSHLWS